MRTLNITWHIAQPYLSFTRNMSGQAFWLSITCTESNKACMDFSGGKSTPSWNSSFWSQDLSALVKEICNRDLGLVFQNPLVGSGCHRALAGLVAFVDTTMRYKPMMAMASSRRVKHNNIIQKTRASRTITTLQYMAQGRITD